MRASRSARTSTRSSPQGWKIVVVGLFVFVGTFIGSAVIAEVVLRMMN